MDPEELARLLASGALTRKAGQIATQFRPATPSSYDADAHTVDLTAATGTRVKRYSWMMDGYYWEELAITAEAVNLDRVTAGQCPLLDTHSRWGLSDQFGLVLSARFEGGELVLGTKFRTSAEAVAAEADVAAGTVRGVSIGYVPVELTLTSVVQDDLPVYLVTQWELLEVSLCPVPADPAAGVRSDDGLHPCVIIKPKENRIMDPEEVARQEAARAESARVEAARVEAARVAALAAPAPTPAAPAPAPDASAARMTAKEALTFAEDARAFGVDAAQTATWVDTLTPDAARAQLLKVAADKQRAETPKVPAGHLRVVTDERDTVRSAVSSALLHRYNPTVYKLDGDIGAAAREWMGMSLMEMARHNLEENGFKARGLSKRDLAGQALSRANSTSDFPAILANVVGKTLRDAYESSPQTFKAWQRRASMSDFKQVTRTQLGGAPNFLNVPEGGQFKMGTLGDGKEVYALGTYGRIIPITRQVLINDDLDALTRIPAMMGRAAADLESDTAYAPLIANPNMGDGVALFHTSHGNLAGAGAAIQESTIQAAEIAMMSQIGIEGRPIVASPKWLIVSAKDKLPAQKLVTGVQATATGDVNVFSNAFSVVVEVRLNRISGATPWYMASDYNQVDTIEYAYLEGDDGVFLEERLGFETDGIDYKARLDFAAKAIDFRGLFENPGT
jgi:HK97 family phage prohead protease